MKPTYLTYKTSLLTKWAENSLKNKYNKRKILSQLLKFCCKVIKKDQRLLWALKKIQNNHK
jgi:hypothetical protein